MAYPLLSSAASTLVNASSTLLDKLDTVSSLTVNRLYRNKKIKNIYRWKVRKEVGVSFSLLLFLDKRWKIFKR